MGHPEPIKIVIINSVPNYIEFTVRSTFPSISLIDKLCSKMSYHVCIPDKNRLTHSCLDMSLTSDVWTSYTFENNSRIAYKLTKHLKESYGLCYDLHFSFKYFP